MSKRELVPLAKTFRGTLPLGGAYVSEKIDGMRCIWDGGVTIGMAKRGVPWASKVTLVDGVCTGLWSRLGNVIHAPDWWVEQLPRGVMLDGELMGEEMSHQETMSVCKRHVPDSRWQKVAFHVFDLVDKTAFGGRGVIRLGRYAGEANEVIVGSEGSALLRGVAYYSNIDYAVRYDKLCALMAGVAYTVGRVVQQVQVKDRGEVEEAASAVWNDGGEGVIIRGRYGKWVPLRRQTLQKLKEVNDSEGVVTGYTAGDGRHEGRIGALVLQWGDVVFEVAGLTDAEREVVTPCVERPGQLTNSNSVHFGVGRVVGFKYRGLSDGGVPIEARYDRSRL